MYVFTTALAVTTGLIVATLIAPGTGASFAGAVPQAVVEPQDSARMYMEIVPDHPVAAMANGSTLAVIFFAVLVGAGVIAAGQEGDPSRRPPPSGSVLIPPIVALP